MDIYFNKAYAQLYEQLENGKAIEFCTRREYGEIKYTFIKREIEGKVNGIQYYDITTAYGYSGPLITYAENLNLRRRLVSEFEAEFSEYCKTNNIVSEFIRFHPIIENHLDFLDVYNVEKKRKTLGTNLSDYEDPVSVEFSKSCKKNIKKAKKVGITYSVEQEPKDLEEFMEIYYSTMKRNSAKDYYYFGHEYFENLLTTFSDNLVLTRAIYEGKTIAAGLYFIYGEFIHLHLSGTLSEYLFLSPAYMLRYGITIWGKQNGFSIIHHGGGTTDKADDTLFLFKKRFAKNTEFDFYTGRKIRNRAIYNQLCQSKNIKPDSDYFPAYREPNNDKEKL